MRYEVKMVIENDEDIQVSDIFGGDNNLNYSNMLSCEIKKLPNRR